MLEFGDEPLGWHVRVGVGERKPGSCRNSSTANGVGQVAFRTQSACFTNVIGLGDQQFRGLSQACTKSTLNGLADSIDVVARPQGEFADLAGVKLRGLFRLDCGVV